MMIADLLAGIFTLVYVLLWSPETVAYPQAGCYYDPVHQICQSYPPAYPPQGYEQTCDGGYYDAAHAICQGHPPAYPIPPYEGGLL